MHYIIKYLVTDYNKNELYKDTEAKQKHQDKQKTAQNNKYNYSIFFVSATNDLSKIKITWKKIK